LTSRFASDRELRDDIEEGCDISKKDVTMSTLREFWELARWAFIAGILANLVARGQALFGSLYSIDGYFVAKKSFNDEIAYNLGDGRFLRALLWRLQELLGFSPVASEAVSLALATVALVAAAILFSEAIFGKRASDKTMLFVALFTLHPFLTEYFYYGEVAFGIALSVLFAALAVRLTKVGLHPTMSIFASAAAGAAALATYQVAIGFILAGFMLASAMEAGSDAAPTVWRQIAARTASFLLGTGIYGLGLVALRSLHPAVAGGRAFSSGGVGLGDRLAGLGDAILRALAPPDGIVAAPVAAISGILVAGGIVVIGTGIGRRYGHLAAIAAGVLMACALAVLSKTPWLAPRLLSPSALVFATFDQRRVNLWDHQLANRIVARLEEQPGFPSIRRLSVVGRLPAHPFPLQTIDHCGFRDDPATHSEMIAAT
jgi:hypothetical protein